MINPSNLVYPPGTATLPLITTYNSANIFIPSAVRCENGLLVAAGGLSVESSPSEMCRWEGRWRDLIRNRLDREGGELAS